MLVARRGLSSSLHGSLKRAVECLVALQYWKTILYGSLIACEKRNQKLPLS